MFSPGARLLNTAHLTCGTAREHSIHRDGKPVRQHEAWMTSAKSTAECTPTARTQRQRPHSYGDSDAQRTLVPTTRPKRRCSRKPSPSSPRGDTCKGGSISVQLRRGIGSSRMDRRRNVDLVYWNAPVRYACLVELKWQSDSASEALRQVIGYGAAYVFGRMHRDKLPLPTWSGDGCPPCLAPGRSSGPLLQGN